MLDALRAEEARVTTSLDAPDPASGLLAEQVIGRPDRGFVGIENRTALLQSLDRLSDEDALLQMYFVEEHPVADRRGAGMHRCRCSRLPRCCVRQPWRWRRAGGVTSHRTDPVRSRGRR